MVPTTLGLKPACETAPALITLGVCEPSQTHLSFPKYIFRKECGNVCRNCICFVSLFLFFTQISNGSRILTVSEVPIKDPRSALIGMSPYIIPNEPYPIGAKPILARNNKNSYISVGTERGFIGAALSKGERGPDLSDRPSFECVRIVDFLRVILEELSEESEASEVAFQFARDHCTIHIFFVPQHPSWFLQLSQM